MTFDCSLGETEALVMRAGRGAGLSWGQAQEAGRAVVRLAAAGLPAVTWLASALPKIQATPYAGRCPGNPFDLSGAVANKPSPDTAPGVRPGLCPVALGCGLADALPINARRCGTAVFEFESVWSPALIAGFLLPVAKRLGLSVRLKFNQTEMVTMHGLISSNGDPQCLSIEQAEHVLVILKLSDDTEHAAMLATDSSPGMTRCEIDDQVYAQLQAYAYKTYVPSTAVTRAEGAGAGLTDND